MARPSSPGRVVTAARAVRSVAPLAAPLGAVAVALFLLGRLLDALFSGALSGIQSVPNSPSSPAPSTLASAAPPAVPLPANTAAPSAALVIDALAVGRYAQVRGASGIWPRRGAVERFRLDAPPRLSAASPVLSETSAPEAVETARALLGREYRGQEVLASRLVLARFLAPEEAGTSVEGGVPSQLGDIVLAERPAWLILFKVEDRTEPPPPGWTDALPGRTLVELLLIDATTGALLLRPPAALFADFEAIQLTHHPAADRTRPLGYFGDAAP